VSESLFERRSRQGWIKLAGFYPCQCEHECGEGDPEGPGVCKGLPMPVPAPLVEIVLVHRSER